MSFESLGETVNAIYASAVDAGQWEPALRHVEAVLGARGSFLGIASAGRPDFLALTGYERQEAESFARDYADKSYVWGRFSQAAEGELIHDRRVMPPELRRRDVFANEWAARHDTTDCVILPLLKRPDRTAFAIFARAPSQGMFESAALELLGSLMPHLQRAAHLSIELEHAGLCGALALAALDQWQDGILLVAADGMVLHANRAAAAQFAAPQSPLQVRGSRLTARRPGDSGTLRRMIAEAAAGDRLGRRQGGVLAIERETDERPLVLFCAPLPEGEPLRCHRPPAALLVIRDPARPTRAAAAMLSDLFRLTRAEARLAAMLAEGVSAAEAARRLEVARTTVVSQLRAIFAKTHTHRQGELIQLLNGLPRLAAEPAARGRPGRLPAATARVPSTPGS